MTCAGLVVRVPTVRVHGHDGRIVGHHVLALERFHKKLLDLVFVRATIAHTPADLLKRSGRNGINDVAGGKMGFDLVGVQGRFELRDQVL